METSAVLAGNSSHLSFTKVMQYFNLVDLDNCSLSFGSPITPQDGNIFVYKFGKKSDIFSTAILSVWGKDGIKWK